LLFSGAIGLSEEDKDVDFATLRERVCSKRGTTQEGVNAMQDMAPLLEHGVNVAYGRCNEIMEEFKDKI